MRKVLAVILSALMFTMCFSFTAFGKEGEYELPRIDIPGGNQQGGGTLPIGDGEFETDGLPLDNIIPESAKISISKCTISGIKNKVYTGKEIKQDVTVTLKKVTLKVDRDYTLTYKNNKNIGVATVVISGKGMYKDSVNKTFKIVPKGTSIKKVTPAKKAIKVTWNKQTKQTSGYQVQCATNAKFTKNKKTVNIKGNKKKGCTLKDKKKIKSKKKYYVRVRTFKTIKGKTYYSAWSKTKTVKTK